MNVVHVCDTMKEAQMLFNQSESVSDVAVKLGVPAAVSGLTFFGITLPELVQLITGIYALLMAVDKGYVLFLRYREERNKTLHEIKDEPK